MRDQDLRVQYLGMTFEWNLRKSREVIEKHQVGFDEAMTVFIDPNLVHLKTEHKDDLVFSVIGTSQQLRHLVVVHCEREEGNVIRLISARAPEQWERECYLKAFT